MPRSTTCARADSLQLLLPFLPLRSWWSGGAHGQITVDTCDYSAGEWLHSATGGIRSSWLLDRPFLPVQHLPPGPPCWTAHWQAWMRCSEPPLPPPIPTPGPRPACCRPVAEREGGGRPQRWAVELCGHPDGCGCHVRPEHSGREPDGGSHAEHVRPLPLGALPCMVAVLPHQRLRLPPGVTARWEERCWAACTRCTLA